MPPLKSVTQAACFCVCQSMLLAFQAGAVGGREEALSQQLQALRQICIPEVCFLLHTVLHSSALFKKVSGYKVSKYGDQ